MVCKMIASRNYQSITSPSVAVFTKVNCTIKCRLLTSLLSDQRLNIKSEDDVFSAMFTWVTHLPKERASCMGKLLKNCLCIQFVSRDVIYNKIAVHGCSDLEDDIKICLFNLFNA